MNEDREEILDFSDADDFIKEVKEIDMTFKDHRADDDFERMLAELNGKVYGKPAAPAVPEIEPEDDSIAAALAARSAAKKAAEEQARRDAEERAMAEAEAEKARREAEEQAKRDAAARRAKAKAEAEKRKRAKKRKPAAAKAHGKPVNKPIPAPEKQAEEEIKKPAPEAAAEKTAETLAETAAPAEPNTAPASEVEAAAPEKAAPEAAEQTAAAEEPAAEETTPDATKASEENAPAEEIGAEVENAEPDVRPAEENSDEAEAHGDEAVPAMTTVAVPMGGAIAVSGASQKKRRKSRAENEDLSEAEQRELRRKTEDAHRLEMERLEKEREKRLIESIANIWQSPDFSAGGRVEMNIKTEQRKEIHVTIPPEHEERMKARQEAQASANGRSAFGRRNAEEEARIAAANAALEMMEEPEIPPELLKHKTPTKTEQKAAPAAKPAVKKAAKPKPAAAEAAKPASDAKKPAAKPAADSTNGGTKTPKAAVGKKAGRVVRTAAKTTAAAAGTAVKTSGAAAKTAVKAAEVTASTAATAAAAKAGAEAAKVKTAASISAAIAAKAAEAVADEERTREMSAVIPAPKKESADERRKRREAAEAALRASEEKESAKASKEKSRSKSSGKGKKSAKKTEAAPIGGKYAIGNIAACCAIFFGIGVFLVVCKRESGFIQSENRNLAEKPTLSVATLLDGSYFEDITKWYTDTIPGREQLKPFSSGFEKLFGVTFNNVKITGDMTPIKKETLDPDLSVTTTTVTLNTDFSKKTSADGDSAAETTKKTTKKKKKQTSEELADVPAELDDGAWIGNVVVSGKGKSVRAMSAFYGQFSMGEKYAETINRYREDLGSGINIYTLNMPSSSAYYMPKNLADSFTSQQDCITNIGNNLAGIMNIDTYATLESHKDEYIYSRTDHHWQPLGAYYAAKAFAAMASFDCPDISTYEECKIENFVGTMYAYSNYDEELKNNPDTFIYHKPDNVNDLTVTNYDRSFNGGVASQLFFDYASGVNCYSAILGTDDQITEIETGEFTGRTLVVIKDSFGNAMIPYLTHGFDKIYVIDFRYFDLNAIDFIQDVEATDLLFAVSLAAAHTESHINAIGNLRIQASNDDEALPDVVVPDVVIPGEDDADNGENADNAAEE